MKVVGLYAAEFGPRNSLGTETADRCLTALKFFQNNPESIILVAAGPNLLDRKSPFQSELMRNFLIARDVPPQKIIRCGSAQSTIEEIEAMARFPNHFSGDGIYAVSSWYHLPRILFLWRWRKQTKVHPIPAWNFSFYIFKRAALEPFKLMLAVLNFPSPFRTKVSSFFRRIGLI